MKPSPQFKLVCIALARSDGVCDICSYKNATAQETLYLIPLPNGKTVIFGL